MQFPIFACCGKLVEHFVNQISLVFIAIPNKKIPKFLNYPFNNEFFIGKKAYDIRRNAYYFSPLVY